MEEDREEERERDEPGKEVKVEEGKKVEEERDPRNIC